MLTPEELENDKIEVAESLAKLYKNKDFQKIIMKAYLEDGSKFITRNLSKVKPEIRESLQEEYMARSLLWRFLDGIEEEARNILEARSM